MPDSINILVPKESIDSILATDKAVTMLDVSYRKLMADIEQGQKAMKEAAVTQETLNTASKKARENGEQLDAATKKLLASEQALNAFDKEKYKQQLLNEQALKDQKKAILEEVNAVNLVKGSIAQLTAENKKLYESAKNITTETKAGRDAIAKINEQINKNTEVIRANSSAADKQRMNIGNYKSALEGLPGPLGSATTAATGLGRSLKALLLNPLALAITAVVAAVTGLFKAFKSTEEGGDRVQKIFGKLKGILDVLKQAAQSVSLAFADLLSGKFGKAAEHLKEGFSGIGQRMADAARAGGKLAEVLDQIGDEKLAYNVDAVREKIAQLRTDAAEATDPAERASKLREAIALTEDLYGKEIDWSKRAADAEIENVTSKFAVSKEQLKAFLLADEAGRNEQAAGNAELENVRQSLNNEGLRDLRDKVTEESRLNKELNMETLRMRKGAAAGEEKDRTDALAAQKAAFATRVKMLQDEAAAIQEMAEEDKKTRDDAALASMSAFNQARDEELTALETGYAKGTMATEDYEAEKLRITRKYEQLILQEQLKTIDEAIKNSALTVGQKAELEAKAANLQLQVAENLAKDKYDAQKYWDDLEMADMVANEKAVDDLRKERETKDKEAEERKKDLMQGAFDLANELGNAIFEINNNRVDSEISAIEKKRDASIKAAGDDKEAQAKINEKYDKLVAEQKIKQAKNDRNAALFNIAINTASAAIKGLEQGGPLLMALYIALGAIQAGVVLSKEIPKYAKGTHGQYNTPERFIAGEAGTEWVEKKSGEIMEVTKPTLFTNAQGRRVYPNSEIKMLSNMMIGSASFDSAEIKALRADQKAGFNQVSKALADQKQYIVQNGKVIGFKVSGYARTYLERMVGNGN